MKMQFDSPRFAIRAMAACCVLLCLLTGSAIACAQSVAGKWTAVGSALDNGEIPRTVFDLKVDGSQITGSVRGFGFEVDVKGTAAGSHFELFGVGWNDPRPFLTGGLTGGQLEGKLFGDKFTAHPFVAADEFPKQTYLEPPAVHDVGYNGLAKTPPMGWNSWNLFANKVNDQTVRTMADAMVTSGMRDAGYVYVNIDDTWEGIRDEKGNLPPNRKFPDMKALADYVHSKGLKLGIYSSPGPRTCGGYPGSYGHEEQDARMFASWGIDYLKYDWCSAGYVYKNEDLRPIYQKMGEALKSTGRPIVFSLCEYGMGSVEKWGPLVGGNLWRTTGDIRDEWDSMIDNIHRQVPTAPYAGPGHWNDPDMLEIGNGHMSADEYRTHMSLWALTAAPLLAGNDIRNMSDVTKSILLNKEVIAVNQDALGKQASPNKSGDLETWIKPLADGSVAVGVVNLGSTATTAKVSAQQLGVNSKKPKARDLWAHADVQFANGEYSASVPSHGVLMLRVSPR